MPYGLRTQPYKRDDPKKEGFQVWGEPPKSKYTVPLGHMINYGHYRKTESTLEQVYLSGMIESKDPQSVLVPLAWSWIVPPKLILQGAGPSYTVRHYDPTQKAYVVDSKSDQNELEFELLADPDYYGVATTILNPVIIVRDWGKSDVELEINEKRIERNSDFRVGYEATDTGTNLVLWLKFESKEPVVFTLRKSSS